ncbi:MAG TPA: histidinol-phosphatase HisJ family protein [Anaerolineales bacterium]|nr:histidinol-phosphatase HisJ family protein [Anaerolineae bacterium]HIQ02581.1 histidinol-phosphatase HisJ family protein [Anaerolineales bacterium]
MSRRIADYHVHTRFSCDSDATMEAICRAALAQGMREIAITDHADFEPLDPCHGYFQPELYWEAVGRCRATFEGQLMIRAGVECGESHVYRREVAALLSAHDYDFVLGSLHWVDSRPAFDETFFDGLELGEGLALYFDELARLADQGEYDVLAHPDIIRRAVYRRFGLTELDLSPHETQVRRMLRIVAERGKGLEVNTAYLRKGMGEPGPSVQVLRWFREEGGQVVTLGSDGHRPEHVGAGFDRSLAMVREAGLGGLTVFHRRTPTRVLLAGGG